uniref:CCHC-type domain-containing protein n=1 Tax=Elaeophora elaphi TaxID=1147741 RepID=A0A0R3S1A7_9BILA
MEGKNTHPIQEVNVDNAQHTVSQSVQRIITDNMQQESADSVQQHAACLTVQDGRQAFNTRTTVTTDALAEDQIVCSKTAEADVSNRPDGQILNVQDSQEPETTWQDDEHEFETQMSLLNKEWRSPEVNEVMTKLLKGELSFAEAADQISVILGHEINVASVRNRALYYSDLSQLGQSSNRKECEDDGEKEGNIVEKRPGAPEKLGPGFYEVIRNLRGHLNSIAIKEPQSNGVRIYRRSTTRHYYSYYRCSTCDHLSRHEDCRPSPIIKMVSDTIVGEPFPLHRAECKPISLSQLRAMQTDRENRQEVINEMMTPFEAWSKGDLRALLEEARKVSQLARQHPQWKKVKYRPRNENETHPYARPCGETLVSYEEKIRKKLNKQLKRPDSRASSVVSERFGAQTPTDDEWSFARRGQDGRTFVTDESQSLISDLTEVPDADGLLSEERVHIEQSRISMEGTPELNKTGKFSYASRDSGEPVNNFGDINQTIVGGQIPASETGAESGTTTVVSMGTSKVCSASDCSNRVTVLADDGRRDIIRETNRKLFMVDDEHLLKLFRRCPDCGGQLKTLALSSRKAIPTVRYKCQGICEEGIWFGYEPK